MPVGSSVFLSHPQLSQSLHADASQGSSSPSVVDGCCLSLGALLSEVKGWGNVLVLLSILSLRQDMLLGLWVGPFQHPCPLSLSLEANPCLACLVALGKESVSSLLSLVQDPGLGASRDWWLLPLLCPQKQVFAQLLWQEREHFLLPLPRGKQVLFLLWLREREGLLLLLQQLEALLPLGGGFWWELGGGLTEMPASAADSSCVWAPDREASPCPTFKGLLKM